MPEPPHSSSTVMPSRPSAPNCGQSWRGNLLVRSISAAIGAIFSREKAPHRVAQHVDVVAEAEIKAGEAVRDHRALLPAPKPAGYP